ncbi:GldG family protein [Candidatus Falkowbacteria bacterium]|nr:GldG family protein [Candidatus Falkowbacteria bacterium]
MNFSSRQRNNVIISTAILAGIIIVVNIISNGVFNRVDLTSEKVFTITDSTRNVLKNLDDTVTIKAYFSRELPAELLVLQQEIKDTLDEYKNYSGGKLKVKFIDPADDEELVKEVQGLGIPQVQFNIRAKDKLEVRNGYFGLAIMYLDKREVIPLVQNTATLEYDLTAGIKKVSATEVAKIGFLAGHGEWEIDDEMIVVKQDLQKQYEVTRVDLSQGHPVAPDIATLVIASPKEKISDKELFLIDQFLMRGGNLFVALDTVGIKGDLTPNDLDAGLGEMLESYGLKYNRNLVLDVSSNEMVSFSSGFAQFFTSYPYWPKIMEDGFDAESVITSELEALVLPWVGTVEVLSSKIANAEIIELAKTTGRSWVVTGPYNLDPQQQFSASGITGPQVVGVAVSGGFESYFVDKLPLDELGASASLRETEGLTPEQVSGFNERVERANIVFVGDGDFMQDGFISRFPDNRVFFENVIDYLSLGEELIAIRSRGVSDRSLKEMSDGTKGAVKYLNILGVTVLVVIYGVLRFWRRKKKRFEDEL